MPLLYGIIAILILVVGLLLGYLLAARDSSTVAADSSRASSTAPVPPPSTSNPAPVATRSTRPTETATTPPTTTPGDTVPVTFTGAVRVTRNGINLAGTSPGQGDPAFATLIYDSSSQQFSTNNSSPAALWTEPAQPTHDQCVTQLNTQALSFDEWHAINYSPNLGICVVPFGANKVVFIRIPQKPAGVAAQTVVTMWASQ